MIHEEEGEPHYYWRAEDSDGSTSWRKDDPRATEKISAGDGLTTAELLERIEVSLKERRRASRGRKLRLPFR